jgi:hypothetical protein
LISLVASIPPSFGIETSRMTIWASFSPKAEEIDPSPASPPLPGQVFLDHPPDAPTNDGVIIGQQMA